MNNAQILNNRKLIPLYCILSNLLVGNAILFFTAGGAESANYYLMTGMSIACTTIYFLVYRYVNFRYWNYIILALFSILICAVIEFIGAIIATFITPNSLSSDYGLSDLFLRILTAIVIGLLGNIVMFPLTILFGLLNVIWFVLYQKKWKAEQSLT